jgi:glycosyltransferase involved in cell wall biosynthesis
MAPFRSILLSVALVTRNRPGSPERAIASLRAQDEQPFEIVVSDDSDEEFTSEIETIAQKFGCRYFRGPRRGLYANRNFAKTTFWPHEDTDMFCQMALLSKVHFLPDRLYLKRVHPTQGISDGARVQRSSATFRVKWDNRQPKNAHEAALLRNAKKYYYSTHKPFRDVKVARAALSEFFAHPTVEGLRWCMQLIASALDGFLLRGGRSHLFTIKRRVN